MGFNVSCTPGKNAAATYMRVHEHLPSLVMYLDPVNISIQLPPFPGGDVVLAEFCRELAREATRLADEIDPTGEPAPLDHPARYLVILGSSGGGY